MINEETLNKFYLTYNEYFQDAAEALSGRPVVVRFRRPATQRARGEYFINAANDLGYIDIRPELSPLEAVKTLAHETSHARHDHYTIEPVNDMPAESVARDWGESYASDPRESKAENWAKAVIQWAQEAIENNIAPGDPDDLKALLMLAALKYYQPKKERKENEHRTNFGKEN